MNVVYVKNGGIAKKNLIVCRSCVKFSLVVSGYGAWLKGAVCVCDM